MYQRIFVPVDDSATSRYALGEALRLAKLTQATVRLVHVVDLAQFGWGGTEFLDASELQGNIKATGEAVLNASSSLVEAAGLPCNATLLESWGDKIAEVLVEDADKWDADLIVMGSHGRRGLEKLMLGSVTQRVLGVVHVPVLVVRD